MLRDITIENYRLFEKFRIEGLTQVNLLVGANNSGKSSLLEAIYLLVNYDNPLVLLEILDNRGEFVRDDDTGDETNEISEIFRGHQLKEDEKIIIVSQAEALTSVEYTFSENWKLSQDEKYGDVGVGFASQGPDKKVSTYYPVDEYDRADTVIGRFTEHQPNKRLITSSRLGLKEVSKLWDKIVLTPKEDMVLAALQILEPNLERVAFTSLTTLEMSVRLKIKDNPTPVPLGSMGDGMYRILALAISLVSCENGVLLVDEIDTGLHHKALTKMWRVVLETAKKLNIQVFATTHSWDALAAFQRAMLEVEDQGVGAVFRLQRKNGQIEAVTYSSEELAVAVEQDIEVR